MGRFALLKEDWNTYKRKWTPGFAALTVHRFGAWRMKVQPRIFRLPFSLVYRIFYSWVIILYGIELPYQTKVGRRLVIGHQNGIVISHNSVIGDDCVIIQNVTLGQRPGAGDDAPTLGNGVLIGAGAVLIGGIVIGDNVKIGPNSVVMNDVPSNSYVFGNPARVIPISENPPTTGTPN
ncbi:MAG: serine O-acetyltransferase [bacterium]